MRCVSGNRVGYRVLGAMTTHIVPPGSASPIIFAEHVIRIFRQMADAPRGANVLMVGVAIVSQTLIVPQIVV